MFKCWIYISGEEQISLHKEERLSEKQEVYVKSIKEDTSVNKNESTVIESYIPEMRRFGFFDRFINFS